MPTKLKNNQLGPWCSYCEPKTTRAVYMYTGGHPQRFACQEHFRKLAQEEIEDEHMTEADCQTWGKL